MSAGHAENEHFTYDITSKLKTKFLGNSADVYPVGRYSRCSFLVVVLRLFIHIKKTNRFCYF